MNAYIKFLRNKSGDDFGGWNTATQKQESSAEYLRRFAKAERDVKLEKLRMQLMDPANLFNRSKLAKIRSALKDLETKTAENINTAEDLLNASSEERSRFEKIALQAAAQKQSIMTNAEQKAFAKKNKKLLKVLKKEGYVPSTVTGEPMEASNSLIPSIIKMTAGAFIGGVGYHFIGKMRKKSGSLSEKPIDFLSRKKELESQGRIPGRITSVRGPFAPSVQQVPFQGQAQIIDLGAQMTRRLEPITPDQVATMEADAMNTFPQLMNQLGSQQGKRKLSQIAQINADNTKALIMEAHLTGRKLDFDGKKYTVSALKVLLMGNPKAERNFMRNYGRVFTSAIKRFDG